MINLPQLALNAILAMIVGLVMKLWVEDRVKVWNFRRSKKAASVLLFFPSDSISHGRPRGKVIPLFYCGSLLAYRFGLPGDNSDFAIPDACWRSRCSRGNDYFWDEQEQAA